MDLPDNAECLRVEILQRRRAVAHDQVPAIVGQPPTLAGVAEGPQSLKGFPIIDKTSLVFPCQLIDAIIKESDALAEDLRGKVHLSAHLAGGQFDLAQARPAL